MRKSTLGERAGLWFSMGRKVAVQGTQREINDAVQASRWTTKIGEVEQAMAWRAPQRVLDAGIDACAVYNEQVRRNGMLGSRLDPEQFCFDASLRLQREQVREVSSAARRAGGMDDPSATIPGPGPVPAVVDAAAKVKCPSCGNVFAPTSTAAEAGRGPDFRDGYLEALRQSLIQYAQRETGQAPANAADELGVAEQVYKLLRTHITQQWQPASQNEAAQPGTPAADYPIYRNGVRVN